MCLSQSRKQDSPRTTCGEASVSQVSTFLSFQSSFVLVPVCSYGLSVRRLCLFVPLRKFCQPITAVGFCFVVVVVLLLFFIISFVVAVFNILFSLM